MAVKSRNNARRSAIFNAKVLLAEDYLTIRLWPVVCWKLLWRGGFGGGWKWPKKGGELAQFNSVDLIFMDCQGCRLWWLRSNAYYSSALSMGTPADVCHCRG